MGNIDEERRILHALTDALRKLDASVWLLNGAVDVGGAVVWGWRSETPRRCSPIWQRR